MTRRRRRIHRRERSATELELHAAARPDQAPAPRELLDRDQEVAAWWDTWLAGGGS